MKKYLITICAAAALVGCAKDRGGVYNRSSSESGSSDRSMQSTNSSAIQTNQSNVSPSSSDRNYGTDSQQDNSGQKELKN